ncbi:transposase family protein [Hymenobacter sp. PAMC 26628]|uniref:transposase family protein n=1 Tax=Hymenobacter sp. PAMC 26628 TaxID=1484118 RepID=UPI001F1E4138|nr:transposase family protein [Hymenobacter sp. PAMC 26628]
MLFVSKMYEGHTHDFTIFKEIFAGFDFSLFRVHVDSGFYGLEQYVNPHFIFKPIKASKTKPLTSQQRQINTLLASGRVRVEHAIAKIKAFFSLRIENRLKDKRKLDDAMAICAGLANFKTKLAIA